MSDQVKDAVQNSINDFTKRKEKARLGGGEDKIRRQHEAGFLTARERINLLVDENSFMELGGLNHSEMVGTEDKSSGDGLIVGVAKVGGRPVVVQAGDKTVFAGTEGSVHIRKARKIHEYALRRGLPMFNLQEGGGLRMPDGMGSDGISDKLFPNEMLTHNREVPLMTAILGDSFGGPTWAAVSSDFVTQLKGTCMAVAGPRMLEMATGQKVSTEELGGWEVHASKTGQVDSFAETEEACIQQMKDYFSYMPLNATEEPPFKTTEDCPNRLLESISSILPDKANRVYDMKKIISEIVDEHTFFEYKEYYGGALLTMFARLDGRVVGIVANQPKIYAGAAGVQECEKATDFICLCDSFHIPLIFLHDTPGFRISNEAEKLKIPTKIMVWNQALAQSTVPKLSVVIRKSIGAAYANMCGPTMGADLVVAWPTAEINFTGPEVGINVVYGRQLEGVENSKEVRQQLLEKWAFDSSPYKAAGKHLIDDVIDPKETRQFLCRSIEIACIKKGSKSERRLANWPTGF
ncbi:acetyl-CoA carboxylase carboxyltransferase component [Bacillus mesophilus]|uniref:Methylmalonyl-CoA decarboxylase n=1 Tax=Bacillus mesophilus TaxID=1808955 RepID=A0A6M0Q8K7_9BACI|nr:carboxyl transferase domain-containing protein [Bacillus mesophilus]MBM7662031.1 acetyl-CoA carboxylase carboxyltransferase component [Bacillus mesophilus]NEY72613.1 methylmalonyl-CoA decarboxylase [Bacillus mesophilus]